MSTDKGNDDWGAEAPAHKIAPAVAETEFERFVEAMDLLTDPETMDAEERTAYDQHKARIVREITRGHLVINENGEAVLTPSNPRSGHREPITFYELTGATLMSMDGKKKNHDVAKGFAMMDAICKATPGTMSKLAGGDVKVCQAIFALLMD